MLSFKPAFSLSSFSFIKRLFSSSLFSAIRVVSSPNSPDTQTRGNTEIYSENYRTQKGRRTESVGNITEQKYGRISKKYGRISKVIAEDLK